MNLDLTIIQPLLELARLSPFLYLLMSTVLLIATLNILYLYLLITVLGNIALNRILKQMTKHWYRRGHLKSMAFLGRGHRPNNAQNCGVVNNCSQKISTSFGMPSGHSQIAWAVCAYLILHLWNTYNLETNDSFNRDDDNNDKNNGNDKTDGNNGNDKTDGNDRNNVATIKKQIRFWLSCGIIIGLSVGVSWSRVLIGCHTIQQVIVGGIIGSMSGAMAYYVFQNLERSIRGRLKN